VGGKIYCAIGARIASGRRTLAAPAAGWTRKMALQRIWFPRPGIVRAPRDWWQTADTPHACQVN